MSRMTSKAPVLSPVCSLSSSQSLPVPPLSFAFRDGALAVEVGHDADAALVAPFGSVACTHTHDSGIVCCIPHLRCRLPKQSPYARGLSRAEAYGPTLMSKRAIPYQLGLKECRDASSAGPFRVSLRQARRPWGPQYCAVYDRLVLPDVEMPQGPLVSATGATAPVADRAHHLPGPFCTLSAQGVRSGLICAFRTRRL